MADKTIYLNNTDEQISAQKRSESGDGLSAAVGTVGAIAGFLVLRRKIQVSKAISSEIRSLRDAPVSLSRYLINEMSTAKNAIPISKIREMVQGIIRPLPTAAEQIQIARLRLAKVGVKFDVPLPGVSQAYIDKWGWWNTLWKGPAAAIAPGAVITLPGRTLASGPGGGILFGETLFNVDKRGKIDTIIKGVKGGITGTSGERYEFLRAFGHNIKKHDTLEGFVRETMMPLKRDIMLERKRYLLEGELAKFGASIPVSGDTETSHEVIKQLMEAFDLASSRASSNVTAASFLRSNKGAIEQSYRNVINQLVAREIQKPSVQLAHKIHKIQADLGVGPQFARHGAGHVQERIRDVRNALGHGYVDPFTGSTYKITPPRYIPEGTSLSGLWNGGEQGRFFVYPSSSGIKRRVATFIEGTFFKQFEDWTGMGLSVAPNRATNFINAMIGAKSGSGADFFVRKYIGGFGRLAVLGFAGYAAYSSVNFLAKQATGWGVNDVAGKMYTTTREFQQHVINQVGLVGFAKKTETAFPGTVKSPAAMIARATAPYWGTMLGRKLGGPKGAMLGLGLGIAVALTTWGDITQSPEELHRIYTGEQDIPVRKGRWWMWGKTPFGGGKISYFRPHWYPLMRSNYKNRGQLWDSDIEEFASKGPLAPILTPLLLGRNWDPYYWEKRHYRDRPYPMTGELFEPTMPFAWLGNMTIGSLIKPHKIMHPEYWGAAQGESGTPRTLVPGGSAEMGIPQFASEAMLPNVRPGSTGWLASEGAYTLAEQMGIRGYATNLLYQSITGRPDFLPEGPVVQTARRATGYERSYWDMNIGDPSNVTEFFRRILPHRRRGIEEYNPIPNTMPDWMPGEDYFINFRQGDPFIKVEMGEARLPGAGYESLHRLHSGVPGVYDAIDRFLILSDVAPYSNEYKQYMYLAKAMAKKDDYWGEVVKRHLAQREKAQEEYEFLDLEPPEEVTGLMRPISRVYRKTIAALGPGGLGGLIDPILGTVMMKSPFPFVSSPLAKFFPYRTAEQTYRDFRLYGSEFTEWGQPYRDFIRPAMNKAADMLNSLAGHRFIPNEENQRRQYEEYFDRMQYIKYKKLARMAQDQNNASMATKFDTMAAKTMTGINAYGVPFKVMGAIPKRERAFFAAFSQAEGSERNEIIGMVSPQMARIYRAQWNINDGRGRGVYRDDKDVTEENVRYFSTHRLPENDWTGWHPDVDMKDVQLKIIRNEGMNIHNFDLWESQERSMRRRPYVPELGGDINQSNMNTEQIRRNIMSQLELEGYDNTRVYISQTPARVSFTNLKVKMKRDRSMERSDMSRAALMAV